MAENKIAKVPVASHGLHKHDYNYPWLSSINFGDVMPCYYNPLRKGERDNPKAGLYSQLMPIMHNAFATGRYNFKAIFVPYKLVWRPWYAFDQQQEFMSNGRVSRPERYPYTTHGAMTQYLTSLYGHTDGASADNYDVATIASSGVYPDDAHFYLLDDRGRRVLRILGALGCTPSFIEGDKKPMNIITLMCYIKAFSDYYFPNNYVGGSAWLLLSPWFERDEIDFTSSTESLIKALEQCSLNFYENCVFDLAWDNPTTPNVGSSNPVISISDPTDPNADVGAMVDNTHIDNGTVVVNSDGTFTQFVINALKNVSAWLKRRQISGARLIDKFLISRGVELPNDSARISYFLGQRNVEIEVSSIANTTDTNLGELAGKGVASSGNEPLSFECRPDDDGIFFIIVSPVPDANYPIYLDGFNNRKDFLDNYNAEFDKLGCAAVPSSIVVRGFNGCDNRYVQDDDVWGFLNQYWDEVQEKPRLLGDFCLKARGSRELQAYHTFRILNDEGGAGLWINPHHGYGIQRMSDNWQYQRLFGSDSQENLMLFLRWFGSQYKEKLPLGDSYEWDDDEMNRRVSIVTGGSQK